MYVPRLNEEREPARLHAPTSSHPFGMLVASGGDGGVEIAHVPILHDAAPAPLGRLRCHGARANPVWRVALQGEVTVVFRGPDGYVSPRLYELPRDDDAAAPDVTRLSSASRAPARS
jgi:transcriptional regulator